MEWQKFNEHSCYICHAKITTRKYSRTSMFQSTTGRKSLLIEEWDKTDYSLRERIVEFYRPEDSSFSAALLLRFIRRCFSILLYPFFPHSFSSPSFYFPTRGTPFFTALILYSLFLFRSTSFFIALLHRSLSPLLKLLQFILRYAFLPRLVPHRRFVLVAPFFYEKPLALRLPLQCLPLPPHPVIAIHRRYTLVYDLAIKKSHGIHVFAWVRSLLASCSLETVIGKTKLPEKCNSFTRFFFAYGSWLHVSLEWLRVTAREKMLKNELFLLIFICLVNSRV